MKTCSKCGLEKDESQFNKRSENNILRSNCKSCCRQSDNKWEEKNKEERKLKHQQNRLANLVHYKQKVTEYAATEKAQKLKKLRQEKYREKLKNDPDAISRIGQKRYVTWVLKPDIMKRDNYCCQRCLTTNNKLILHHIIPAKEAPDKIINPDNLITLCRKCHKEVHEGYWQTYDPLWQELAQEKILCFNISKLL